MKYVPRSCTQFRQTAGANLVRIVKHGIVGRENLDLAVLVGHARVAELRWKRRVLRPCAVAVVLHDHRPARRRVVQDPLVVRAKILPAVVGADANHDGVVATQVGPRQRVGIEQLHRGAETAKRGWNFVAGSHHVADDEAGREPHVHHLHRHACRNFQLAAPNVRVLDGLKTGLDSVPVRLMRAP